MQTVMQTGIILGDRGWLAPGGFRWAKTLVWMVVLAALCIAVFNLAADASLRLAAIASGEAFVSRASAPPLARLVAIFAASAAMLAAYAGAVRLAERRSVPELALRPMIPDLVIGLAVGTVVIAMIIGLLWAAGWATIAATPITRLTESVKESIQSGVIEEVLMRIILFRLLWRAAGVIPALVAQPLLFGALHLANPDATVFAGLCLVAGEGIGIGLYALTGRIWMPIGMHVGWNFALGWIFGSAVSGVSDFAGGPLQTVAVAGISPLLSGGGFGAESSLAALLVSLAASLVCLSLAWRAGGFSPSGVGEPRA